MMTLVAILAIWGIVSVLFTLSIAAAAAKTVTSSSRGNAERMETAQSILERLNLVSNTRREMPVPASQVRAH
jgi:hypothetical protein